MSALKIEWTTAPGLRVVKIGGELVGAGRRTELDAILAGLAARRTAGDRLVLVHGGGPQVTALQAALGQTAVKVGGRRVTDAAALEALKMAVGGQVNVDLVSAARGHGLSALGLTGVSGGLVVCERRPPSVVPEGGEDPVDYGFVGRITGVDRDLFGLLLGAGHVPVVACIGGDAEGTPYNINADEVANAIAIGLTARSLVLLTSTPGVLRDKDDPSTRIPRLSVADGRQAIVDGVIQGGMIPKVEEAMAAIEAGVGQVLILGHVGPGELEEALTQPGRVGTTIEP